MSLLLLSTGRMADAAEAPGGEEWIFRDEVVRSWNAQNGLPSNHVTALAQTEDGWLWVGTSAGLVRFDGARFVIYGEKEGLPRVRVEKLTALPDGRLWISKENRRNFWLEKGRARPDEAGFRDVVVGGDGKVYGVGEEKVTILPDGGHGGGEEIPLPARSKASLGRFGASADGTLWFCPVVWLDPNKEPAPVIWVRKDGEWRLWEEWERVILPEGRRSEGVAMTADGGAAIWLAFPSGVVLKKQDGDRQEWRLPPTPAQLPSFIQPGRAGETWLKVSGGDLHRLSEGRCDAYVLSGKEYQPEATTLLAGREGEIWVGTSDSGLFRISHAPVASCWNEGIASALVGALLPDARGGLIVGTGGGGVWQWRNGTMARYTEDAGFNEGYFYGNALLKARNGSLWIGTGLGLHEFRDGVRLTGGDDFTRFLSEDPALSRDSVYSLLEDEDGTLWVGCTVGGLFRLRAGEIEKVPLPVDSLVFALERDARGDLWVGTWGGGIVVLKRDGTREWFRLNAELPDTFLSQLHLDARGGIWAGTVGKGLYLLRNGRFVPVPVEGGRELGTVGQIQEDEAGWIWVGTSSGICGLDVAAWREGKAEPVTPLWLGAADGLMNGHCTRMKAVKDAGGRLYFGTTRGFVSFLPAEIRAPRSPPFPIVETVEVNGVPRVSDALPAGEIGIPPGAPFEVRFTGLKPGLGERIEFRYRLAGLDEEWTEAGARRVAPFFRVPPGRYRFEVQAGFRGNWSPVPATVALRAMPHYWETWWFRSMLAATALAGLFAMARALERRRMRHLLVELERKRAVNEERERIARDLHDGLGAGLTQAGMIAAEMAHPEGHAGVSAELGERIRSLALELDSAVWMTNPVYDWLPSLCNYLGEYAQEFFGRTAIRCRLDMHGHLPQVEISPVTRHHLFLAMKECLNNVLKHSGATEVWLSMGAGPDGLRISIRDNGRGYDQETAERKGRHGLKNLRERLEKLDGRVTADSSAEGTTVALTLPLPAPK